MMNCVPLANLMRTAIMKTVFVSYPYFCIRPE